VLLADNGNLVVSALANLLNGTLTGGSYIARGFIPADASTFPLNSLEIGQGAGPGLLVDAANIVLDGPASEILLFDSSSTFVTLQQELGSIAAAGMLALLDDYGYVTDNTLTDAGLIALGGGTLSTGGLTIAAGGR
jgi:hypothetical protein